MTSTPTRPVDNVVITTKGLQDRNINILDGTTVENKGKLILTPYDSERHEFGLVFAECGDSGCVFQCPFQAGRDQVCNCPRGPRVQTGKLCANIASQV